MSAFIERWYLYKLVSSTFWEDDHHIGWCVKFVVPTECRPILHVPYIRCSWGY